MAQDIEIMIAAVVIAVVVMYVASGPVAHIRRRASDDENAGAGVSGLDRRRAGGGWIRIPYSARYIYASMAFAARSRSSLGCAPQSRPRRRAHQAARH